MAAANPSNAPETGVPGRMRVPMSMPMRKLHVPDIPGYKLRWMMGTAVRIEQAQRGGYEFVQRGEVEMTSISPSNPRSADGNSDLGDRVSISAGGDLVEGSQGIRLYLMKIPEQFWNEDQALVDAEHERLAAAIRGDGLEDKGADNTHRYVPEGAKNRHIFQPKPRRA